jgi:hypothetical protein
LGVGVRHALFPGLALGASQGLPASRRHSPGKRSCRPHSRAVQRLAVAEVSSEASRLARLVVAPPAGQPSEDTSMIAAPRLHGCAGSATAVGGALARCHGSDLLPLKLLFAHRPAVPFLTSPAFWKVVTEPAAPRVLPGTDAHFVSPFGAFRPAVPCGNRLSLPPRADSQ